MIVGDFKGTKVQDVKKLIQTQLIEKVPVGNQSFLSDVMICDDINVSKVELKPWLSISVKLNSNFFTYSQYSD